MKRVAKHPGKSDTGQTKAAGGDFFDKLHAYRDLHAHSLFSSLGRLLESPFNTFLTIGVLAIAITLAASFYILVVNVQQLTGQIEFSNQISLYLKDDVFEPDAEALAGRVRKYAQVREVRVIGKEQAFRDFQTYSGFGSAITAIKSNPLPIVLEVMPANALTKTEALNGLLESLKKLPEVDLAQMDRQWLDRLRAIADLSKSGLSLISLVLAAAVLFITGNTIRLELQQRRDEVIVAKLVGATNGFIKRPFLYCGFWIGLIAGIMAWFMVTLMLLMVWRGVDNLSQLYGGSFHLLFLNYSETLALLAISAGLSVLSSWLVLTYQLNELKPE